MAQGGLEQIAIVWLDHGLYLRNAPMRQKDVERPREDGFAGQRPKLLRNRPSDPRSAARRDDNGSHRHPFSRYIAI
jgi:hypothetical protein